MKHMILWLIFTITCSTSFASSSDVTYSARGRSVEVLNRDTLHACLLDKEAFFAVESFDKSAVIISERGYVPVNSLKECVPNKVVHVSMIPARVGQLADINLNKRLYVAVDFISVNPMSYLATVARLNSTRNLVTLPGAYIPGRKFSKLRESGFMSLGNAGSALISPDGRYVAPAGQIDCSDYASPGVWDIEKNKIVLTSEQSCRELFYQK
ncbi:hypothetical protein [Paraburkholderia sp. 2C]